MNAKVSSGNSGSMQDLRSPAGALGTVVDEAEGAALGAAAEAVDELGGAALVDADADGGGAVEEDAVTADGSGALGLALGWVVVAGGRWPVTDETSSAQRPRQ